MAECLNKRSLKIWIPFFLIMFSFLLIELFAFIFLDTGSALERNQAAWAQFRENGYVMKDLNKVNYWPIVFGVLWGMMITIFLGMLPRKVSVIFYGVLYFLSISYAVGQTGYFLLFQEMMWLSDFRYASEGADYLSVILSYPLSWYVWIVGLLLFGGVTVWKYPGLTYSPSPKKWRATAILILALFACAASVLLLPKVRFRFEENELTSEEYNRSESSEAAYENMFNVHRLYQICGIYQTAAKDIYANYIYPFSPFYREQQELAKEEISDYFAQQVSEQDNPMTGVLADQNVILVLMESIDDWMVGEHTPVLNRLMAEGINFTNFYTPVYGGVRTFNTEYCMNTGNYLSSSGGYALDYVNNSLPHSLPNQLAQEGYNSILYHYNTPDFYSRGYFSKAMGYSDYVSYVDYVEWGKNEDDLHDDQLLFDSKGLSDSFFRAGKRLNFVITRSAHLPYRYNDSLSVWGLEKYPQYRGLTGNEETDCSYLKAKLVDDFFARMLAELEARGELENTVIVGVTDHYTYGYNDTDSLLQLSGVENQLLLEKTPCFIWSRRLRPMTVDKILNTTDLVPTVLNLMGIKRTFDYMGQDAFDDRYEGFAPFSDGSWIADGVAYISNNGVYLSVDGGRQEISKEFQLDMKEKIHEFIRINNLILKTDYYRP